VGYLDGQWILFDSNTSYAVRPRAKRTGCSNSTLKDRLVKFRHSSEDFCFSQFVQWSHAHFFLPFVPSFASAYRHHETVCERLFANWLQLKECTNYVGTTRALRCRQGNWPMGTHNRATPAFSGAASTHCSTTAGQQRTPCGNYAINFFIKWTLMKLGGTMSRSDLLFCFLLHGPSTSRSYRANTRWW
jgi:hypothetical protein